MSEHKYTAEVNLDGGVEVKAWHNEVIDGVPSFPEKAKDFPKEAIHMLKMELIGGRRELIERAELLSKAIKACVLWKGEEGEG